MIAMERPQAVGSKTFAEKQAERLARLKALHGARNEARAANHQEVVNESTRMKLPANYESRKRQAEWLLNDKAMRAEAQAKGQDYDRVKLLNVSALEADGFDKRKKKKKNPDEGFSDFEAATARQYQRLVKGMAPKDMQHYEEEKARYGDAFYGGKNVIIHGMHQDRPQAVDNMVKDLEGQIAKREKYSRRRTHNDDADIDYINERNARFNRTLDQFYGEYTSEIKQNLERGTAV